MSRNSIEYLRGLREQALLGGGGHVPGARNLDPHSYASDALPPDVATPLVFYCSNPLCRKAPQAARRAKAMGYTNVRVMSAGIVGWRDAGLPVDA